MAELAFHGPDGIASVSVLDNVEVEIIDGKLAAGGPPLAFHSNGLWQIAMRDDRLGDLGQIQPKYALAR